MDLVDPTRNRHVVGFVNVFFPHFAENDELFGKVGNVFGFVAAGDGQRAVGYLHKLALEVFEELVKRVELVLRQGFLKQCAAKVIVHIIGDEAFDLF